MNLGIQTHVGHARQACKSQVRAHMKACRGPSILPLRSKNASPARPTGTIRIHCGNGKDPRAGQGFPSMMPLLRSGMPELTQQKQKEGKATCSRKGDSISRRCCRGILLGQGPCELVTSFASRETRRHVAIDVKVASSRCRKQAGQGDPQRGRGARGWYFTRTLQPLIRPQDKSFSRGIM